MAQQTKHFYDFGDFRIDTGERVLLRDGKAVPLTPKVFDTLLVLVEQQGQVVSKDELMQRVWPASYVEEGNLTQNISTLRKLLGESPDEPHFIETVPRRGYRFVARVSVVCDEEAGLGAGEGPPLHTSAEKENGANGPTVSAPGAETVGPQTFLANRTVRPRLKLRRNLLIAAVILGLSLIFFYLWRGRQAQSPSADFTVRTLAVLPFKPLVAGNRDEYLELGLADALITKFSNLKDITVRPTAAVLKYHDPQQDPVAAGREQRVEAVVEGRFQKVGDRIRLTVQLVRVSDGRPLWAEAFDEAFTNIFSIQDSISARVAEALTLKLSGDERKLLAKRYTNNPEAYQLYVKGRFFWNKRTEEGVKTAIEYFNQAVEKDPSYALAYGGLADSYSTLGIPEALLGGMPPREVFPKAKAAAIKALEIDEALAEAHAALGHIHLTYDWDWQAAEKDFNRAIALNPNYATARFWHAISLSIMGRGEESPSEMKRAQELDPLSLIIGTNVGRSLYYRRQYDRAIEQCRKTLDMDPNFAPARYLLALILNQEGRYEEAIAELERVDALSRGHPLVLAALGQVYATSGRRAEARRALDQLQEMARQRFVSPYHVAHVYAGLGEKEEAFIWLEKAFAARAIAPSSLKSDPAFDRLRSDSRFMDLLGRMNLAP